MLMDKHCGDDRNMKCTRQSASNSRWSANKNLRKKVMFKLRSEGQEKHTGMIFNSGNN